MARPSLAKIEERRKNVSKRKKKEKKLSIKSNIDIWEVRQEKPPELPSLHPLNAGNTIERTTFSKTRFNSTKMTIVDFSEKVRRKEGECPSEEEQSSLKVLEHPPRFRSKMYFK